ncbi:MAG TPA: hypothetical protein VM261_19070 [Kofleriaceae bacterium]|nr:hypothetical protein [Kofleriaceae bacterium]
MFRALLTAVALASATSATVACGGGGGSGPKVVAGAPAGDVTEVTGTVTATREGKARPLAVGDVVSGDDVISTGTDGHVAIRLHHNLVPWTLGPGKTEQVSMSLAWKAPRATQTAAGPTGERSGAAGRHAEREAADTSATAGAAPAMTEAAKAEPIEEKAAAAAPAPGAAPAPPPPPPADDPMPDRAPRAAAGAKMAAGGDGEADKGALLGDDPGDAFGAGGLGLSGTGEGGGGTGEGIGLGGIGTLGHGSGTGQGQGYGAGGGGSLGARAKRMSPQATVKVFAASGGLDTAIVTRIVRSRQARFIACTKGQPPGRATIKMTIKPDGKVDAVTVSGASSSATDCLTKWTRATTFPAAKSLTTASILVQTPDPLDDL